MGSFEKYSLYKKYYLSQELSEVFKELLTMVTRNFSLQDLPFSRLLTVPEDEKEFMTLEELKPHHLTELNNQSQINNQHEHQYLSDQQLHISQDGLDQNYSVYYDLNTQQKTKYELKALKNILILKFL